MLTYAFFLSNHRESLVRAFRKKTPPRVRKPGGGGAKGGTESVHRNVTIFFDGFPNSPGPLNGSGNVFEDLQILA